MEEIKKKNLKSRVKVRINVTTGIRRWYRKLNEYTVRVVSGLKHKHDFRLVDTHRMFVEDSSYAIVYQKRFDLYRCEKCGAIRTEETVEKG